MLPPKEYKKLRPDLESYKDCRSQPGDPAIAPRPTDALRDGTLAEYCSKSDPEDAISTKDQLTLGQITDFSELIGTPAAAARLIRSRISLHQEELWLIALSPGKRPLGIEMVFRGTADSCTVHPRDIVRRVCALNASSFILSHNHPSDSPAPSIEDWKVTRKLIECGRLIEVPLLDHVIVTQHTYRSMASLKPDLFSALERR